MDSWSNRERCYPAGITSKNKKISKEAIDEAKAINIIEILKKKPSELSRSEATLVKAIHEWEEANNISFGNMVILF